MGSPGGAVEADALVQPVLQLWLYEYYGDLLTLSRSYEATARWIAFLQVAERVEMYNLLGRRAPSGSLHKTSTVHLSGHSNVFGGRERSRVTYKYIN